MSDRPIIFSAPMIRALLDGRKTQTRRVLKPQPHGDVIHYGFDPGFGPYVTDQHFESRRLPFSTGDRLWVRESMAGGVPGVANRIYRADGEAPGVRWRPSIHMPRWASRLTLLVTDVKVERLQDISEWDAVAEGTPCYVCEGPMDGRSEADCHCFHRKATAADFRDLWNSIHGADGWSANPWVAAISFDVIRADIDADPSPARARRRRCR